MRLDKLSPNPHPRFFVVKPGLKTLRRFLPAMPFPAGKGIAGNNLRKVFKPGFTTKKRGWGLGLSLSKRIIEQYHNGSLAVKDSEIGKGTTFRIMLRKV